MTQAAGPGVLNSAGRFLSLRGVGNASATGYMLIAVIGFALIPAVIALSARDAPFLFAAGLRAGGVLGFALFMALFFRRLFFSATTWRTVGSQLIRSPLTFRGRIFHSPLPIILATISHLEWTFFALSTQYIDITVATVIYEIWPILLIWVSGQIFLRYNTTSREVYFLSLLGFAGIIFVVLSEVEGGLGFGGWFSEILGTSQLGLGFLLIFIALVIAPLGAFGLRWGVDLGRSIARPNGDQQDTGRLEFFGTMVAFLIGNTFALIINLGMGTLFGEQATDLTIDIPRISEQALTVSPIIVAIAGGFLTLAIGGIAWRRANLVTHDLGVNTLFYMTPVVALLALYGLSQAGILSHVNVLRPDYLIIGATAVIVANLLINFGADRLLGFKALMISAWGCGALVYLRPPTWLWEGEVSYFTTLALSATVFTLIFAFRVARLSARILDEDNRGFLLVRRLEALAERGVIDPAVCEDILEVNRADGPQVQEAYDSARQHIATAILHANPEDTDRLVELEVELDSLTHSRQQGINFGELCAIAIFGGITLGISLFALPQAIGRTALLIELFIMLFSAVIVFLTVSVWDLRLERVARIMSVRVIGGQRDYGVLFQDETRRHIEQGITVVVGLLMVATYAGLLGHKWLGWFS